MSRRSVLLAALILVVLPFVAGIVHVLISPPTGVPGGDFALLELATREALEGTRLLGPYSRFEWNHPGPAMFYLLAAPYWIFGAAGLHVGTLALNAVMAAGIVAVNARRGGTRATIASAVVLLALALALGPDRLRDPWNPYLVIFPTLLAAALAVASWSGSLRALLAAAMVGSIAAQSHIATAPFVLGLLGGSAVVLWRRRNPELGRLLGAGEAALTGVLILLWLPPVIEQFTAVDGNLGHLLRFAIQREGGHTLAAGISAVGTAASVTSFIGTPSTVPAAPTWSAAAVLTAVVAVGTVLARRSRGWTRTLALGGLLATATAAVLATRIVGDLLTYLVVWMVVGPVLIWTAAAIVVARRHELLAAAVAATMSLVAGGLAFTVDNESRHPASTIAAHHVLAAASQRDAASVALVINDHERWSTAAGVALALDRAGIEVRVVPAYVPMFGEQRLASGEESLQVVVAGAQGSNVSGLTPLGWAPHTRLYVATARFAGHRSTAAAD